VKELLHQAAALFGVAVAWIVGVVGKLGYAGIIVLMALESSFVPFPSEVVIPPAGYLTVKGDMNIVLVILAGIFGSIVGAAFNYLIAYKYGRKFLDRYGKYMLVTPERLAYMDNYFSKHGEITTLIGRLIPVVRQYISFPAGLARMNFAKFVAYTGLGAGIWVVILALVGRSVGNNIELVKEHTHTILLTLVPVMIIVVVGYILIKRYYTKKADKEIAERADVN
jgi:membrane protein DedA with SNARE-associated domain